MSRLCDDSGSRRSNPSLFPGSCLIACTFCLGLTAKARAIMLYIQMKSSDHLLDNCLYFTAGKLHRALERMAEECFADSGLSPSHAFLILAVEDKPGISVGELARVLHLAPSTLTRFVDKLALEGLVKRTREGRSTTIHTTGKGRRLRPKLVQGWQDLYRRYSLVLGEKAGEALSSRVNAAGAALEAQEGGA